MTVACSSVTTPTLLLNESVCKGNIARMAQKAARHNLVFRPHFKTHQSYHIGRWFRQAGVERITVSSLSMAAYFARHGWQDITVAFPVNLLEIQTINRLARAIKLNLLVESTEAVDFLSKNLTSPLSVFIKIDVGYSRTGILPGNTSLIDKILEKIRNSNSLAFAGFLAHAGHSYQAETRQEILGIHTTSLALLQKLKKHYLPAFPHLMVSVGDTPTCSLADNFDGIDEIRPGNFVFYDLTQWVIGSCGFDEIALAMACPVVAKHLDRNELIIYGGAVHFSKDFITPGGTAKRVYGKVVNITADGWQLPKNDSENYIFKLSQEHGTIKASYAVLNRYNIGDLIGIIPAHACLTANLMKYYRTLSGKLISRL